MINFACQHELKVAEKTSLSRRSGLLDGFLASTGLDLTPFCTPPLEILS
jgi:hypothetical protein